MNIRKMIALLLALAMCLAVLSGCGAKTPAAEEKKPAEQKTEEKAPAEQKTEEKAPAATEEEENVVKIGLVFPLSGPSGSPGQINVWAITDYFEYYNEKGGIQSMNGAKLVWETRDTEGAADIAVSAAEALIGDESICCLMGTYNSGTMSAVSPVVAKYNMPMMGVNSVGSYCYTTENECIAHVVNLDQQDFYCWLDFYNVMKNEHGIKTVYMCADNSELSTNNMIMWNTLFEETGIEVVGSETFNANASDFSTTVQKIKAANPDLLVLQAAVNDAILLTQTLDEYDVDILTVGQGAGFTDPTYLEAVGELANGMIASGYYFSTALGSARDPELAKKFADKHMNERGLLVNEPWAVGWTAAAVLVDAIERAGSTDRAAIAKALMETKIPEDHEANCLYNYEGGIWFEDFECRNGDYIYNQNPNAVLMLAQYEDDEFQVFYPANNAVIDLTLD